MIRRTLIASVAALALLAAPAPARADIGPGDLTDFLDDLVEALLEMLLTPEEDLSRVALPAPLPEPVVGEHVDGVPITVNESLAYAEERIADRTARIEALDAIAAEANEASVWNTEQLEALEAANATPPVSIAAGQQINTQAVISMAGAVQTMSQVWNGHIATLADDGFLREHSRAVARDQDMVFSAYPEIAGGVDIVPGHVPMPW